MRLIITRHGETLDNVNEIIQGHLPGKLTEKGIQQAKLLGKRLQTEHIDFLYCSDLKRAFHTAREIQTFLPQLHIITTTLLRERNQGKATGKKKIEVNWDETDCTRETSQQLLDRAEAFLYMIANKHPDNTVLLVCHGRIGLAIFSVLEGTTDHVNKLLANTAISIYEVTGTKGIPLLENCTKHLIDL